MAVEVVKKQDKQLLLYFQLHERAKRIKRERACRKCGTIFRYTVADLTPSHGAYATELFFSPQIGCPSCGTWHVSWFRTRLIERWVAKYLRLRFWEYNAVVDGAGELLVLKDPPPAPPAEKPEEEEKPKTGPRIVEL